MEKLKELLTSRKFLATVTAIGGVILTGIQTGQPPMLIVAGCLGPFIAWILAQAHVDAAKMTAAARVIADVTDAATTKLLTIEEAQIAVKKAFLQLSNDLGSTPTK